MTEPSPQATSRQRRVLLCAAGAVAVVLAVALSNRDEADATAPLAGVDEPAIPPELGPLATAAPLPPLQEAESNAARKAMFIDYLAPIVDDVNDRVRKRRAAVLAAERRLDNGEELAPEAVNWLADMVERYRVDAATPAEQIEQLKRRVDIIPASLAVAQAGIESAWGTSRFARQGNNVFGKWCFTPGCGIVPARRPPTASYEVEAYDDVAGSVRSYIHHLNSHPVYEVLRERRAEARAQQRRPTGVELAAGLEFYSAKGYEYVEIIRGVIHTNELQSLAQAH